MLCYLVVYSLSHLLRRPTSQVDSGLGKLEYDLMHDQQLMEFFIAGANNRVIFRDANDNFYDVCEWDDVECKEDNVVLIAWNREWGVVNLKKGTIGLDWLPPKLRKVNLSDQYMTGTLETKLLPSTLKQVYLGCNRLHGTLDMPNLPKGLLILHLDCNNFEGPLVLTSLPPNLAELELDENEFHAEELTVDLPESVISYAFDGNHIDKLVDPNGVEIPIALV